MTSIGVQAATRDAVERVKREFGARSLDATLRLLLEEHENLKARTSGDDFLLAVAKNRKGIARLAKRHHVRRIALFGSVLHGDARHGSDLDLLVEFAKGKSPGLIGLGALERELTELLGVPIDLQTPGSLSPHIRDAVLAEALVIYVEA